MATTPKTVKERRVDPIGYAPIVKTPGGMATEFFATQWNRLVDYVYSLAGIERNIQTLENAEIIAGAGLDGGGALKDAPITIDANASAILDQIASTQGSVLYRGAASWVGLPPGVAGQVLSTNGAGVDPAWVDQTGGGGSGSSFFSGASGSFTGTRSGTAFATKGIIFKPDVDITVSHITAWIDPAATTDQYLAQISSLTGVTIGSPDIQNVTAATVDTVLGTTNTVTVGTTDMRAVRFDLPTPVTMVAGTYYLISTTFANGALGTSICGVATDPTGSATGYHLNAPGVSYVGQWQFATLSLAAGNVGTMVAGAFVQLSIEGEPGSGGVSGLDHPQVMARVSLGF